MTVLRRTTGGLFVAGALAFAGAATVLSSTFDWPDILREPASVVLPAFVGRRDEPGLDLVRHRLDVRDPARPDPAAPAVLGRQRDPVLRVATFAGATSVVLSLIGFLRWVFVVPPLADSYVSGDAVTRAAVDAAWTAQHQFGGALLGEHLGQLLAVAWSVAVSVTILRTRVLPRWLGVAGLVVSALYLTNQGDILATAVPGFPVWDLGGLHRQHQLGTVGRRPRRLAPAAAGPPAQRATSRARSGERSRPPVSPASADVHRELLP